MPNSLAELVTKVEVIATSLHIIPAQLESEISHLKISIRSLSTFYPHVYIPQDTTSPSEASPNAYSWNKITLDKVLNIVEVAGIYRLRKWSLEVFYGRVRPRPDLTSRFIRKLYDNFTPRNALRLGSRIDNHSSIEAARLSFFLIDVETLELGLAPGNDLVLHSAEGIHADWSPSLVSGQQPPQTQLWRWVRGLNDMQADAAAAPVTLHITG